MLPIFLTSLLASTVAANKNVVSSIQDLHFDENGKLAVHHLFFPAASDCPATSFQVPHGFESTPLEGEALRAIFPGDSSSCPVACGERGTDRGLVHAILPERRTDDAAETQEQLEQWVYQNCVAVEACVLNYHDEENPIEVWWVGEEEELHHQLDLEYGQSHMQCYQTHLSHRFAVRESDTEEILEFFTVEHSLFLAIGEPTHTAEDTDVNFDSEIEQTLRDQWESQKMVQRRFTPLGFQKAKLPEDVQASMQAFYYNNRHNYAREEWDMDSGPYVNWWERDCYMIEVPFGLRRIWQHRLKELVEAWAGEEIEQTDMYGMRRYAQGARLLTHVDRVETHAVSLIVNVAQGNLSRPWPVEINDHDNQLHEFVLEPGEMLFYESAKCLHGRNHPLAGTNSYYVNLFTHYRPIGNPEWYREPNAEVEEASLSRAAAEELKVCRAADGVCYGHGLSDTEHTVFQATSGEDLIRWWRETGEEGLGSRVE